MSSIKPIILFNIKDHIPPERLEPLASYLTGKLPDFNVIFLMGDIEATVFSDKQESIKSIDIKIDELQKLKDFIEQK